MYHCLFQLLPEWAPNVHPLLVHFPIGILFFAALMDLLSFFLPLKWWDDRKTAIIYLIGGVLTIGVYFTGGMAADSIHIPKAAYHAVGTHAGWATWTVWFFGIYGLVRFAATFMERIRGRAAHLIFFLLSLIGLFFLFETGEHGAKLVFDYGLGTGQLTESKTEKSPEPTKPGFHRSAGGAVTWIAGSGAKDTLSQHFTFLKGNADALNAVKTKADSDEPKSLIIQTPDFFFVTNKRSYGNIQIKASVNPDKYTGNIVLAHNIHDADDYACMILQPDGSARLARYIDGKSTTIKKGTFDGGKVRDLTLTVSGKHIHGSVNGKEILHGHSKQTGPGAVGIKLKGTGTFKLKKISISPLSDDLKDRHDEENNE